jgi:predicted amidohydrolase YtcJ
MVEKAGRFLFVAALWVIPNAATKAADPPADIVLRHGSIHTEDGSRRVAAAMAVRGHVIVAIGPDREIDALAGKGTKVIDLAGRTVLPGLIDAHTHPAASAQDLGKCNLGDEKMAVAALLDHIRACLKQEPGDPKSWFEVVQVNPSDLALTARDLDQVLPDRPLMLSGTDGHNVWANSAAMRAAGIAASTADPKGGRIDRDAAGAPAGAFRDTAQDLIEDHAPRPSLDHEAQQLDRAFAEMRAVGITSVQDASVDDHLMAIYKRLYDTNRLKMRVRGTFHLIDLAALPETLIAAARDFRTRWAIDPDFLRADAVKIFADGVIEFPSQTAALLQPYLDSSGKPTDNRGPTYVAQDNLNGIVALADADGFTVHIHAIGDRAVRSALDAFAFAQQRNGVRDNRHQIAHLQLVDPADYPRFKQLGVIANFQLDWADIDDYISAGTLPFIGPERASRLYPARSLRDAGATIAGGSDWNVSSFDPFEAIERGVTRRMDKAAPPLDADQALTVQDMVDAYTINAARALRQDRTTGSLEPGKRADFVILDQDIFAADPYSLHATKVLATWLDGKQVYARKDAKSSR